MGMGSLCTPRAIAKPPKDHDEAQRPLSRKWRRKQRAAVGCTARTSLRVMQQQLRSRPRFVHKDVVPRALRQSASFLHPSTINFPPLSIETFSSSTIKQHQLFKSTPSHQLIQNDWRKVWRKGQRCQGLCSIVSASYAFISPTFMWCFVLASFDASSASNWFETTF